MGLLQRKKLVIITIPAYNEERTIGRVIDEIKQVMAGHSYRYKIHVQNDGSRDQTVQVAKKHGAIVNSNPRNLGLIKTFEQEMLNCLKLKADIIVHTDADGQYDSRAIPHLIAKVEQGYDLVMGSRFKRNTKHMNWGKRMGNILFAKAISRLVGTKITDSTTGFRAFTAEVAREIKFINSFTYTQEQTIRAAKMKMRIVEIGVPSRRTRESRLFNGPLQYAIKAWINIFRIYRDYDPLKFFGTIGLANMAIGGIIAVILVVGYFIGALEIDRHIPSLLLAVLFGLTGLQILLFGFLADQNEKR